MNVAQYFPQGIATGKAFLGREEETKKLLDNFTNGKHTLLISPRRYGKTSLVKHALGKANAGFSEIDLFLAIDGKAIESRIIDGIEALIQKFSEKPEQWVMALINFFKKNKIKWTVGFNGLKLEIKPGNHDDVATNILDAFNALEHILSKKKQKAVVFIDECQEICKIKEGKTIEGAIRHFAQSSKYLVFIFSGSNRKILEDIFGNKTRPLYSLCQWIALKRLPPEIYFSYLKKVAKQTFSKATSDDVLLLIIKLTQCHPETTYGFCYHLWQYCSLKNKMLSAEIVQLAWKDYAALLIKRTKLTLAKISHGQLKLLILVATGNNSKLTGKNAQSILGLTSPTIVHSLKILIEQDLLEQMPNGEYRIIDPVIKSTLSVYYANYL